MGGNVKINALNWWRKTDNVSAEMKLHGRLFHYSISASYLDFSPACTTSRLQITLLPHAFVIPLHIYQLVSWLDAKWIAQKMKQIDRVMSSLHCISSCLLYNAVPCITVKLYDCLIKLCSIMYMKSTISHSFYQSVS